MIAAQLLPIGYALVLGCACVAFGLKKPFRASLIDGFMVLGYLCWRSFFPLILSIGPPWAKILGRFGLVGYIALFAAWQYFQPCARPRFTFGGMGERIKFPFVWFGFNEYIWRFILVFCSLCTVAAIVLFISNNTVAALPYGFIFSLVNSILEEMIWRFFILGRAAYYIGERQALIVTSLAFGFYHLSLGFSVGICLLFAVGGVYMGGCALKSRAMGASVVMHFFMNNVFTAMGIIL